MSRLKVHHIFPKAQLYKRKYKKPEVNALAKELSPRAFWIVAREFSSFEAARGLLTPADSDTGLGSDRPLERRTVPGSLAVASRRTGLYVPVVSGRSHSVVRRLRRLTRTSGRPPIGSPQRVPALSGRA
jgi:hypothetical protein